MFDIMRYVAELGSWVQYEPPKLISPYPSYSICFHLLWLVVALDLSQACG